MHTFKLKYTRFEIHNGVIYEEDDDHDDDHDDDNNDYYTWNVEITVRKSEQLYQIYQLN